MPDFICIQYFYLFSFIIIILFQNKIKIYFLTKMLFPKKKGFTQFPDKYETKYPDTPPIGYYKSEDADK